MLVLAHSSTSANGTQDQYDVCMLPTITGLHVAVDVVEQTALLEISGDFGQNTGQVWKGDLTISGNAGTLSLSAGGLPTYDVQMVESC